MFVSHNVPKRYANASGPSKNVDTWLEKKTERERERAREKESERERERERERLSEKCE